LFYVAEVKDYVCNSARKMSKIAEGFVPGQVPIDWGQVKANK